MLSEKDTLQLKQHGISIDQLKDQLENFKNGFPPIDLVKAATINDGIIKLETSEVDDLIEIYKSYDGERQKFVPASGAATRMFKDLAEFKVTETINEATISFISKLSHFPFFTELKKELENKGYSIDELTKKENYTPIIDALLNEDGLNYGSLPKGLIKFHTYESETRTAFEEHIVEGTQYARKPDNSVSIHLTVSPEHKEGFLQLLSEKVENISAEYGVSLDISFSEQKKSTDIIAVDAKLEPIRDNQGNLLLRPGGHGALIENLNDLSSDIIFIKNIDNVVPDRLKPQTVLYKKALAGLLISYQSIIFDYISIIQGEENSSIEFLNEVLEFTINELCTLPPSGLETSNHDTLKQYLLEKLCRPLRVCGMVKNEGEPGGGPFWTTNPDGTVSLQIIESSQVDMSNPRQKKVFGQSTHFNPVDLVCGINNVDGQKFNLLNYTNPKTGFITTKSLQGKEIMVQELPGLWNGAMANWNTIFVEVPLVTFNPVKTILDLLREQHQ